MQDLAEVGQVHDRFLAKPAPLWGGTFDAELPDVTFGERIPRSGIHHA